MALGVYSKIPIYPIYYLLKGEYKFPGLEFLISAEIIQVGREPSWFDFWDQGRLKVFPLEALLEVVQGTFSK